MLYDEDFEKLSRGYSLVTINVIYYLPDFSSLLNEFMWQTVDIQPRYPRVIRFLDFWRKEIEAVIKEVQLQDSRGLNPAKLRHVDGLFKLQ